MDADALMKELDEMGAALTEQAPRPAAQAGAQVFYDMVRTKAPVSTKAHSTKGKKQTYQPGNLRNSVYQVYSKDQSTETRAVYDISVNSKKAFYWRFVEFGTKKRRAHPFLRPSFYAAEEAAQQAMVAKFVEEAKQIKGISSA
ncbi:hypothetical protein CCO03_08740 [Comamonas serinivorans]|uniref:HK97 gp10 family phage protein n=1 Tax=Comamonas serinivorans TaxID=1082851 RepID=A0A1Y0EN56_9BURK|nr:HK97-gp10 family putative phage morphogenesis protein [Comamonas serinivorans]ARU04752.1 hypothetical protein CCO03_08740 [Comamonas serinivorans]